MAATSLDSATPHPSQSFRLELPSFILYDTDFFFSLVGHFGGGGGGGVTSWRSENYMPEFIVISIEGVRLKNSLVSLSRIIAQT